MGWGDFFNVLALGIPSAVGGALGSKSKQTSTSNFNQTTTPNLSPQQSSLYDALNRIAMQRLQFKGPGLEGYEAQGLGNINTVSNAVQQSIQNRLAAQGLLGSPVAANASTQQELARGGQSAQFLNSLPLLQRQLQNQDIGISGDILRLVPFGQTSSGSGTNTTTGTSGGGVGGALSGLGSSLGFLYGLGAFGGRQGNVTGVPEMISPSGAATGANPLGISPGFPGGLPTLPTIPTGIPGLPPGWWMGGI